MEEKEVQLMWPVSLTHTKIDCRLIEQRGWGAGLVVTGAGTDERCTGCPNRLKCLTDKDWIYRKFVSCDSFPVYEKLGIAVYNPKGVTRIKTS